MIDYLNKLQNITEKKDLDLSFEGFLHELGVGIKGISFSEVNFFSRIASLFNNYYKNIYHDPKQLNRLNEALFNFMREYIKDPISVEIKQVLVNFPQEFIAYLLEKTGIVELRIILMICSTQELLKRGYLQQVAEVPKEKEILEDVLNSIDNKLALHNLNKKQEEVNAAWEMILKSQGFSKTKASLKAMEDYMERLSEEISKILESINLANPPKKFDDMTVQKWIEVLGDGDLYDYRQTAQIDLNAKKQKEKTETVSEYKLKNVDKQKSRELELKLTTQTQTDVVNSNVKVSKNGTNVTGIAIKKDSENFESTVDFSSLQSPQIEKKESSPPPPQDLNKHYEAEDIIKDIKSKHKSGNLN